MNSNDAGEECRRQYKQYGKADHCLCRSILNASAPLQDPNEDWADGVDQEKDIRHSCEEDVQGGNATAGVDEGYAQGQEYPAHDVVTDTRR